jgi:glycine/D-amino acid oxidase-like deaminating enzyme
MSGICRHGERKVDAEQRVIFPTGELWNGYVGMTTDFLPRIHRLGPDAYGLTGCNGRAVALSIALGDELSKAVRGIPESELALPFSDPAPIMAHGLLRRLAPLMLVLYRRRDAWEIA